MQAILIASFLVAGSEETFDQSAFRFRFALLNGIGVTHIRVSIVSGSVVVRAMATFLDHTAAAHATRRLSNMEVGELSAVLQVNILRLPDVELHSEVVDAPSPPPSLVHADDVESRWESWDEASLPPPRSQFATIIVLVLLGTTIPLLAICFFLHSRRKVRAWLEVCCRRSEQRVNREVPKLWTASPGKPSQFEDCCSCNVRKEAMVQADIEMSTMPSETASYIHRQHGVSAYHQQNSADVWLGLRKELMLPAVPSAKEYAEVCGAGAVRPVGESHQGNDLPSPSPFTLPTRATATQAPMRERDVVQSHPTPWVAAAGQTSLQQAMSECPFDHTFVSLSPVSPRDLQRTFLRDRFDALMRTDLDSPPAIRPLSVPCEPQLQTKESPALRRILRPRPQQLRKLFHPSRQLKL